MKCLRCLRSPLPVLLGGLLLACGGGGGGGSTTGAPQDPWLSITTQPVDASVAEGQTATFSVFAAGHGPVSFQWRRNGAVISGARTSSYTTSATRLADSGSRFSVSVSDASGTVLTSQEAALTVQSNTFPTQHYVDPVNGSDGGDGSSLHPWKTLQTVVDHLVETRTWEGPLPYKAGQRLVPVNGGAPVKAGNTIWLRTGYYGPLTLQSEYNSAPVTLAAQPGHEPHFSKLLVQSSQNWILRGLWVSPSYGLAYSADTMATLENHSWRGPASDIVLEECQLFSVPDEAVWTQKSDWDTKAASGILATGDRITVRDCRIRNTDFGISMTGKGSWVVGSTVDGFAGDGLRGLGDDEVFEYNTVKNRRDVNDNHPDGFQSWSLGSDGSVGTGVVRNVVLRGNVFIAYENPSIPFAGTLQGIGCFDGFYEDWIVENNVVVTDHWHGISFYGARNVRIVNNTVLDLNAVSPGPPWIMITNHKSNQRSQNCVVRNNLTTDLSVEGDGHAVDHNLLLPLIPAGYFVDVAHQNVRLAPGSPALDQGSSTQAPLLDADGTPRPQGAAVDVGAYERVP